MHQRYRSIQGLHQRLIHMFFSRDLGLVYVIGRLEQRKILSIRLSSQLRQQLGLTCEHLYGLSDNGVCAVTLPMLLVHMDLKSWLQTSIGSFVLARLHPQDHPALVMTPSLTSWDNENCDCQYIGGMHKARIGLVLSPLEMPLTLSPPYPLRLLPCLHRSATHHGKIPSLKPR